MNQFEQDIVDALAAIPHGGDCPISTRPNDPTTFCCENCCGRRARTAARVAAAIEAAVKDATNADEHAGMFLVGWREAALSALRGSPVGQEEGTR